MGALCGLLKLTPEQVRTHLGDFEQRGYVNPTLMSQALASLAFGQDGIALRASCSGVPRTIPSH